MEPPTEPAAGSRKRRRRGGGKNRRKPSSSSQQAAPPEAASPPPSSSPAKRGRKAGADQVAAKPKRGNTMSLLEKMHARLSGGHFRMLNEKLYTCSGQDAFDYFKDDPNLFDVYHTGYQEQMSHWPEQPVNVIISWLKSHNASWTVADFGCGNATVDKNVKNKVFSIDLVSDDPSVIACDMAHTPLEPSSVDVAIFCLSLMGTNYPNYLEEANRVLKPSGWLVIAEVRSRLDPNTGGADPDKFSKAIIQLGFSLVSKDAKNKMFILFYFKKKEKSKVVKNIDWPQLKPCLYKRR
ncbi:ribosomal RNA-processing protein 8-like isoform X2 [Phragmites australis]|uniref:ribosomal RNA-processing protein 8-like isoform X2 n=1 Tax=Phragmites australis TaxID=29695 RepID=UPI002D774AED|nr:ribosomal RNA-processing protein 8-like isoform X2 [Phragmites australis]XP_062219512.1 ribosomal RNA-processing protein 8-like isoform X2 [Phragmites australis]